MGHRYWKEVLSDARYGLGWRIYRTGDEPLVPHAGWVRGYVGAISYSQRRQRGLVVLLNGEGNRLNEIVSGFWGRQPAVQAATHAGSLAQAGVVAPRVDVHPRDRARLQPAAKPVP